MELQSAKNWYITGWSVWDKVQLFRGEDSIDTRNLGNILEAKANEGVKVFIIIWDEVTSNSQLGINFQLMGTHDQETFERFQGTKVKCVLAAR